MVNTGYKQDVAWANETAYGSAALVNQSLGLVQSINPTATNNLIKVRTLGGTRDYNNIVPGKFEVSGSFEYFLQGAAFLRQAIGEDTGTTATIDSGPRIHTGASYLHVMGSAASPIADSFPSFTLEFADDESTVGTYNLLRRYDGCRVNTLALSATIDEPVKISCDWIGRTETISTAGATSVAEGTADPYVFYQGQVYLQGTAVTAYTVPATTAEVSEVNSFDFSVNNNLEATWYISGTTDTYQNLRALKTLIPKGRDYDGTLNLHFADKSMYERFLGAVSATTPQSTIGNFDVVLQFVRSGAIGAATKLVTDDWIRVVLPDCMFNDINIPGAPEDIVTETISLAIKKAKIYVVDADSSYE